MNTEKVYFARFLAFAAAAALAGCAAGPAKPTKPAKDESADVIQQKSVERWNFLIAHQADKAYDYLSPGYRATKAREAYATEMNGRGLRWTKVTYGDQTCEADTCKVNLTVDYKLKMPGASGTVSSFGPLTETWIKVDGRWYYLPDAMKSTKLQESAKP
jgi:hypothetical protein